MIPRTLCGLKTKQSPAPGVTFIVIIIELAMALALQSPWLVLRTRRGGAEAPQFQSRIRRSPSSLLVCRCCTVVLDKTSCGAKLVQGPDSKIMEDVLSIALDSTGSQPSYFAVFDGHGGVAVAELLKEKLWPEYQKRLSRTADLNTATRATYLAVDELTLAQPKGLFGALRARGVGGPRCGATAATAVLLPPKDGKQILVAANVGDSRVVLARKGEAVQLTLDHKPELESERKRIEKGNRLPKSPLVVNVGGTWRLAGSLTVSRAFGDAYLKNWSDGKVEGTTCGYGLIAEPHIDIQELGPDDKVVILATDGLWEALENQEVVDVCLAEAKKNTSSEEVADKLVKAAQDKGADDDIAVIVIYL